MPAVASAAVANADSRRAASSAMASSARMWASTIRMNILADHSRASVR
jgi:hypothetical protein